MCFEIGLDECKKSLEFFAYNKNVFFFFSENIHLQQNSSKRLTENQEKGLNLIFLKQLK